MNKRILIVDDSESIRNLLKIIIENHNFDAETASDGLAAKAILEQNEEFSLVLTDLHMPNMNGMELIEWIRKESKTPFIPILFLTTETNAVVKSAAREKGATGWITKPFQEEKLIQIINKVLR